MRRRWWLFRPLDLIARHFPTFRARRGLLAVRMDGIGDMVLARRSLDGYAAAFNVDPKDVTVLGCESWGRIAAEMFRGYRIICIDEHAYARRPLYRFRVNLQVRRLAPAIAVCDSYLRRAMMADSLVWASAAPRTVVSLPYINEPTRAEFTYYLSQVTEIIDTGSYPTHEIDRHAHFVSAIGGVPVQSEVPKIVWNSTLPDFAAGGPYAVMNPGSNEPGRRWPFKFYVALAERLLAKGWRVAFVGTRSERSDAALLDAFARRPGVCDLTGRTTLPSLLDLMQHAALVVSNDTGPAHLSIALGSPTVVIVGGGHFSSFVPYPDAVCPPTAQFVYEKMDCYHCFWRCHKRASKYDVFPCISVVSMDAVWEACEGVIEAGAAVEGSPRSRPAAAL